ncbi:hypothetical protein V2J09_024353 [Rumex salicifolius]
MRKRNGDKCYSGGVTVTVYVESSNPLIISKTHDKRRCSKPKPSIKALARRTITSSDRRAELLAYSLRLRSSTSQHSVHNRPKTKPKWKWSFHLGKLRHAFSSVLRKDRAWRYERIETEGTAKGHHPRQMACNEAKDKSHVQEAVEGMLQMEVQQSGTLSMKLYKKYRRQPFDATYMNVLHNKANVSTAWIDLMQIKVKQYSGLLSNSNCRLALFTGRASTLLPLAGAIWGTLASVSSYEI